MKIAIITLALAAPGLPAHNRNGRSTAASVMPLSMLPKWDASVSRQKQALTEYRTSLLDFLPSVSAQVSGQYNWGRNIDPETNTYNNVTTFNNGYQISASLPVVDWGHTWNAFRKARITKNTAATALQKAKDDKAIDVMQKFVDAVYAIKSIEITDRSLPTRRLCWQGRADCTNWARRAGRTWCRWRVRWLRTTTTCCTRRTWHAPPYCPEDSYELSCRRLAQPRLLDGCAYVADASSLTVDSMALSGKPDIIMQKPTSRRQGSNGK